MPPKHASRSRAGDLFRSQLDNIIDPRHELVQLGGLIDWSGFEKAFGRFYRSAGRPALPTRLMVGLCYLKHSFDVSDERLLELWVENPYWQHFCGFEFFQHKPPRDPTSLVRYRKRIGPDGMGRLVAIANALDGMTRLLAARSAGMDRQTLRDWVIRYNADGIDGLYDHPKGHNPEKLSDSEQAVLLAKVFQTPDPARDGTCA